MVYTRAFVTNFRARASRLLANSVARCVETGGYTRKTETSPLSQEVPSTVLRWVGSSCHSKGYRCAARGVHLLVPQAWARRQEGCRHMGANVVVTGGAARESNTTCAGCGATIVPSVSGMEEARVANHLTYRTTRPPVGSVGSHAVCWRCAAIQQGDVLRAWCAASDIPAEVFRSQLKRLASVPTLVVMVVDATDFEGSFYSQIRALVGGNPILVALTKCDLLPGYPEGTGRAIRYFSKRVRHRKKVNVKQCFAVSGVTGEGVDHLARAVISEASGRHVYVVGCANAGKSTLTHSLVSHIQQQVHYPGFQGRLRKADLQNLNITRSHLPGTTLQAIRVPCFESHKQGLFDTPGLVVHHRIAHTIFPMTPMEALLSPNPIVGVEYHVPKGHSLVIQLSLSSEHRALLKEGADEPASLARVDVLGADTVAIVYSAAGALVAEVVTSEHAPTVARVPTLNQKAGENRSNDQEDGYIEKDLKRLVDFHPRSDGGNWFTGDVAFSGLCWVGLGVARPFNVKAWAPKRSEAWARPCFMESDLLATFNRSLGKGDDAKPILRIPNSDTSVRAKGCVVPTSDPSTDDIAESLDDGWPSDREDMAKLYARVREQDAAAMTPTPNSEVHNLGNRTAPAAARERASNKSTLSTPAKTYSRTTPGKIEPRKSSSSMNGLKSATPAAQGSRFVGGAGTSHQARSPKLAPRPNAFALKKSSARETIVGMEAEMGLDPSRFRGPALPTSAQSRPADMKEELGDSRTQHPVKGHESLEERNADLMAGVAAWRERRKRLQDESSSTEGPYIHRRGGLGSLRVVDQHAAKMEGAFVRERPLKKVPKH